MLLSSAGVAERMVVRVVGAAWAMPSAEQEEPLATGEEVAPSVEGEGELIPLPAMEEAAAAVAAAMAAAAVAAGAAAAV